MVFQVPESKVNDSANRFEFQLPGEKKIYSLPKMQYLRAGHSERITALSKRLRDAKDRDERKKASAPSKETTAVQVELMGLQREIMELYCPGLYDKIENDQLDAVVTAWQEESMVNLGKSQDAS